MPLTIRPREETGLERIFGGLGTGLGAGLQSGLQALAQQNLQSMMIQNQAPGLSRLLNISQEEAISILQQPQQVQGPLIKGLVEKPADEAFRDLVSPYLADEKIAEVGETGPVIEAGPGEVPLSSTNKPLERRSPSNLPGNQRLKKADLKTFVEIVQRDQKQKSSDRRDYQRRVDDSRKFHKDYMGKIRSVDDKFKQTAPTWKRIIAVAGEGKAITGPLAKFLKDADLLWYFRNVPTEVLQKDIKSLVMGAAAAFDTKRLTNIEVQLFADSLVRLHNTPEGMTKIGKLKLLEGETLSAKRKAMSEVLHRFKGVPLPDEFPEIVSEIADKKIDILTQKMVNLARGFDDFDPKKGDLVDDVTGIKYIWDNKTKTWWPEDELSEGI